MRGRFLSGLSSLLALADAARRSRRATALKREFGRKLNFQGSEIVLEHFVGLLGTVSVGVGVVTPVHICRHFISVGRGRLRTA